MKILKYFLICATLVISLFVHFQILIHDCIDCQGNLSLQACESQSDVSNYSVGYFFKCSNCLKKLSIFTNSYLYNTKISLDDHISLIYHWYHNTSVQSTVKQTGISKPTVIKYFKLFRKCIVLRMRDYYKNVKLGFGNIVEIDESAFGKKQKHYRGMRGKTQWVFGLVERISGKCLLFRVPNRKSETLLPIIQKFCHENTVIHSDCWSAYVTLGDYGYAHRAVNHKKGFKCPLTGAHTNTIEGLWGCVKHKSKQMKGVNKKYIQDYLDEFTFRRIFSQSPMVGLFGEILYCIGKYWDKVGNIDNFDYSDLLIDESDDENENDEYDDDDE